MKKLLLTFLALTASLLPLLAQDYAPFSMGRTPYFQAGNNVYSLRVTSAIAQGADSVFAFNPRAVEDQTLQSISCNMFGVTMPMYVHTSDNQFGSQMRKKASGEYVFEFASNDSFLLKPNAPLNHSWPFSQQQAITATLFSRSLSLVQGLADSVVSISLSNGDTVRISKNYGLIEGRSFYSYLQPFSTPQMLQLHSMDGASIGQPASSPFYIFDYQPGDKFLYQFSSSGGSIMATCSSGMRTREVIDRVDSPGGDSIVYRFRVQTLTHYTQYCGGQAGTVLSPFDTVSVTVKAASYPFLYSLRQEYLPSGNATNYFIEPFNTGQALSVFNNRLASDFTNLGQDTCGKFYFDLPPIGGSTQARYTAGLGLVYSYFYQYYGGLGLYSSSTEGLIAYIKGTETYGNWAPLVLRRESELSQQPLQVYPNPFSSELTLQLPNLQSAPAEILLLDMLGRTVHRQQLPVTETQQQTTLFLPELPAGLYLLQLKQAGRSFIAKVQRR